MPVPASIEALDVTPASNSFAGSDAANTLDEAIRTLSAFIRQVVTEGSDIASASTITPPSTGSSFNVTGTTTITAIGSTNSWNGRVIWLRFTGVLQLTGSAGLVLPGGGNITTDGTTILGFRQRSPGVWDCIANLPYLAYLSHNGTRGVAYSVFGKMLVGTTTSADLELVTNNLTRFAVDNSGRFLNLGNTQPAFRAVRITSDQTSGTAIAFGSRVVFNSEVTDQGGNFNPSTGIFTAPVSGLYVFSYSLRGINASVGNATFSSSLVNETTGDLPTASWQQIIPVGVETVLSATCVVRCAANDQISVGWASGAMNIRVSSQTQFSGYLVG